VNGERLLGMNHLEVVSILKELPQDVRMVCARGVVEMLPFTEEHLRNALETDGHIIQNGVQSLMPADRLVKAKSDGSLATNSSPGGDSFTKMKSR
jgi:multiple PDZ domain protein